ncbi:suppressor of fused domain protein [Sphingobacterium sp.]|uniref:suppressor of fused domain protein n=1 Tax=Sphingobacterium sp. TaxID=341027 RepID=UPI00289918E2|nr:suppressor of fused domain protein [Sphingobacterium sp.]
MLLKKPDFLKSPIERYRQSIEERMQSKAQIYREKSAQKKLPFVYTFAFPQPEERLITAFSYGVSFASHPERLQQVELCLQVVSNEMNWVHIVGYLANQLRTDCPFRKGEIIKIGQQISPDSEMDAFIVAEVQFLNDTSLIYDRKKSKGIQLVQLIPIYQSEIVSIQKMGLDRFLQAIKTNYQLVDRKAI